MWSLRSSCECLADLAPFQYQQAVGSAAVAVIPGRPYAEEDLVLAMREWERMFFFRFHHCDFAFLKSSPGALSWELAANSGFNDTLVPLSFAIPRRSGRLRTRASSSSTSISDRHGRLDGGCNVVETGTSVERSLFH